MAENINDLKLDRHTNHVLIAINKIFHGLDWKNLDKFLQISSVSDVTSQKDGKKKSRSGFQPLENHAARCRVCMLPRIIEKLLSDFEKTPISQVSLRLYSQNFNLVRRNCLLTQDF